MNIGDWLRKWSELTPQKVAVIDDGHEFSYTDLNKRCDQVANFLLQKGIAKGDRVGVLLYNRNEYLEISESKGFMNFPKTYCKLPESDIA
ncbi:MAG: AMP-binding protein [Deltaproteobacteria bacterium]|nr:AMP-binding protein [Deltaproteobacteria bacterium]MBW2341607.1 AMP-binding protein [Deltaproteobacteria bacterium]